MQSGATISGGQCPGDQCFGSWKPKVVVWKAILVMKRTGNECQMVAKSGWKIGALLSGSSCRLRGSHHEGVGALGAVLVPKWTENRRQKWKGNRGAAFGICMSAARLVS